MVKYIKPQTEILEASLVLISGSGPGAGDIGSPSVRTKSIWDDDSETHLYNIREENYGEDWK